MFGIRRGSKKKKREKLFYKSSLIKIYIAFAFIEQIINVTVQRIAEATRITLGGNLLPLLLFQRHF